jgi:hypothetical protein
MITKVKDYYTCNKKLILIVFEIFWIVVFLLDRVVSDSSSVIPQFIYVNF